MNTSPELTIRLNARPPCSAPHRSAAGIAVLALGWPVLAWSDCVDTRKATAAEADFHGRAAAALMAALPPVPVGGKLQQSDTVPTLGTQCKGTTGDFRLEATRWYELNWRKSIVTVAINVIRLPATDNVLSAAYGSASPNGNASLKVNNVVWSVTGSDSPLRQALVDSIDRTRLQGWVGKPLPSVAESKALAAQAVPPNVSGAAAAPGAAAPTTQTAMQPGAPTSPSAPAAPGQAGDEPVKGAVDTVNKLRGLFGR